MIAKMEHLGASKAVVGLVIPTGYSFNLDGTNINMTLATLFLAQATSSASWRSRCSPRRTPRASPAQASSRSRRCSRSCPPFRSPRSRCSSAFDKLMSECRALTNLIGNGVACVVSSRWEGELDAKALHDTMAHPIRVGEEMERLPA
jgi:aerobic C4-dicarboxylate transport protein